MQQPRSMGPAAPSSRRPASQPARRFAREEEPPDEWEGGREAEEEEGGEGEYYHSSRTTCRDDDTRTGTESGPRGRTPSDLRRWPHHHFHHHYGGGGGGSNYDAAPPVRARLLDDDQDERRGDGGGAGRGGDPGGPGGDPEEKPGRHNTCRLTLVCYRPGSRGVVVRHIRTAHPRRSSSSGFTLRHALRRDPDLICTDRDLFREIRRVYRTEMCGFWRTYFSLRSLQTFRLLSYGDCRLRPLVVPLGESTMQEVMCAYRHPDRLETREAWIDWIYRLRRRRHDDDDGGGHSRHRHRRYHALEMVEGWDGRRVLAAGAVAIIAPVIAVAVWVPLGGDVGAVFQAGWFVLALCGAVIALLAVLSAIMPSH